MRESEKASAVGDLVADHGVGNWVLMGLSGCTIYV
jgi:hypothetical protein